MRMHIELDDDLVAKVDLISGPRGRSNFVRTAIERAVEQSQRWNALDSAAAVIEDSGHAWDPDPARWVRDQRHADQRRAG
jgi:Arc/MetJ family transcription regulator